MSAGKALGLLEDGQVRRALERYVSDRSPREVDVLGSCTLPVRSYLAPDGAPEVRYLANLSPRALKALRDAGMVVDLIKK